MGNTSSSLSSETCSFLQGYLSVDNNILVHSPQVGLEEERRSIEASFPKLQIVEVLKASDIFDNCSCVLVLTRLCRGFPGIFNADGPFSFVRREFTNQKKFKVIVLYVQEEGTRTPNEDLGTTEVVYQPFQNNKNMPTNQRFFPPTPKISTDISKIEPCTQCTTKNEAFSKHCLNCVVKLGGGLSSIIQKYPDQSQKIAKKLYHTITNDTSSKKRMEEPNDAMDSPEQDNQDKSIGCPDSLGQDNQNK